MMTQDAVPVRRVALYARKSTTIGIDNQLFNSVDAQLQSCRNYVASRAAEGWVVAGEYSDLGVSGATLDRPDFKRLMRDVDAGLIDIIVAYRLDRLSRSLLDFLTWLDSMTKRGVNIAITSQSIDTTTSEGRLQVSLFMAFGQYEREAITARIRDKAAATAANGLYVGGRPPYGYRRAKLGVLETQPEEAAAVRFIFASYLAGMSRDGIIRKLNKRKAPVPAPHGHRSEDDTWQLGMVNRIIRHPIYKGLICFKGDSYLGKHEAFVSPEQWAEANELINAEIPQQKREQRKSHSEIKYPLKGILRCPHCGQELTGIYSFGNGKRLYRFYKCPHRRRGARNSCTCRPISAEKIEAVAAEQLRLLARNPRIVQSIVRQHPMLAQYNVPSLLAKTPTLISHLSDELVQELFGYVYKQITFNAETGEFRAECHDL